jgi:hypothetical protein
MPYDNTMPCEPLNKALLALVAELVAAINAKRSTP